MTDAEQIDAAKKLLGYEDGDLLSMITRYKAFCAIETQRAQDNAEVVKEVLNRPKFKASDVLDKLTSYSTDFKLGVAAAERAINEPS